MNIQARILGASLLLLFAACGGGGDKYIDKVPSQALELRENFDGLVVADFDGDGFNDIAVGSNIIEDRALVGARISIYRQNAGSPGNFRAPMHFDYSNGNAIPTELIAGDLDADGLPDIVASGWDEGGFRVLLNNAGQPGVLQPPVYYPYGDADSTFGNSIATGDIDADGFLDVIIVGEESLTWFQQDSNNPGEFFAGAGIGAGRDDLSLGDISGDGLLDVVVVENRNAPEAVFVYVNNRNLPGLFLAPVRVKLNFFVERTGIADSNADGTQDIVVVGSKPSDSYVMRGKVAFLHQQGYLQFEQTERTNTSGNGITDIFRIANLDGDQFPELVFQMTDASDHESVVLIMEATATGVPATRLRLSVPEDEGNYSSGLNALAIGDLNNDGLDDIAVLYQGMHVFFRQPGPQLAFSAPVRINSPL